VHTLASLLALTCTTALAGAQTGTTPISHIDLQVVDGGQARVLAPGEAVALEAGQPITLVANAIGADGGGIFGWDPVWPDGMSGYIVRASGVLAQIEPTQPGRYALVVGAAGSRIVGHVVLDVSAATATVPSRTDRAPTAVGIRLVTQGHDGPVVHAPGTRITMIPGEELAVEARGIDEEGRMVEGFDPIWPAWLEGLDISAAGSRAKLRADSPATHTLTLSSRDDPDLVGSWQIAVVAPEPVAPASSRFHPEVRRLCVQMLAERDALQRSLDSRDPIGLRSHGRRLRDLAQQLERHEPDQLLVYWDADGLAEHADDLVDDLDDWPEDIDDVRREIGRIRQSCTRCHKAHGVTGIAPR
jgi:hypothetical protein